MNRIEYVNTKDMGMIRCDYEASPLINGAELINQSLVRMRNLLLGTYPKSQIGELEYELYVYESEDINAFTINNGTGYVIAFSTAMFFKFRFTLKNLFSVKEICEWFGTTPNKSLRHINAVFDYMLWFIAFMNFSMSVMGIVIIYRQKLFLMQRWQVNVMRYAILLFR